MIEENVRYQPSINQAKAEVDNCLRDQHNSSDWCESGAPHDNFRKNICSEDDLRSRIFGTFVVKFFVCLPLLGFSNI